jgi:hypothetical protein
VGALGADLRCLRRSIKSAFSKQSSDFIPRVFRRFLSSFILNDSGFGGISVTCVLARDRRAGAVASVLCRLTSSFFFPRIPSKLPARSSSRS